MVRLVTMKFTANIAESINGNKRANFKKGDVVVVTVQEKLKLLRHGCTIENEANVSAQDVGEILKKNQAEEAKKAEEARVEADKEEQKRLEGIRKSEEKAKKEKEAKEKAIQEAREKRQAEVQASIRRRRPGGEQDSQPTSDESNKEAGEWSPTVVTAESSHDEIDAYAKEKGVDLSSLPANATREEKMALIEKALKD